MIRKVLVVDDDPACTSALTALLQSEGFSVRCASSGGDALTQIEQDVPDVVLTDLRMPGMDGYELLRRVRERVPRIVVVMMSAEGNLQWDSLREGADAYVVKPLDFDDVMRAINQAGARGAETA